MSEDPEKVSQESPSKPPMNTIYYPLPDQVDLTTFEPETDTIDFSMSRVTQLDHVFTRFTGLKSICYRSNLLKSLQSDQFKVENGLAGIKELDFYDNQIEKIENVNQFGATLENLDLSFNRLGKIENLDELVNLKKLYLVHNQIFKIENLDKLTELELLELGDNKIRVIENLEKLEKLTQLYLGKNKIKTIESLFLPNLTILSLQSNRLTKIENLDSLVSLTELYLSDNGLTKIENLEKLQKLRVLDLANNKIERIENIFHLQELEELWFNSNNLAHWEDIELLKDLAKLVCLYMEHNPIYYVNNVKPSGLSAHANENEMINSSYRRKIIYALPNLQQLDATICSKGKF